MKYLKTISCCLLILILASCGKSKTRELIAGKTWKVVDVTPPKGIEFDMGQYNEAQKLKATYYKGAYFKFTNNGTFVAHINGKSDSGRYKVNFNGSLISLYPQSADTIYEQIDIKKLTEKEFDFNTVLADFHMTLHTKSE